MSVIIPRWEFRIFGTSFGAAEEAFAAMTPGAVQETDELYLIPGANGPIADVVKVRFDLMDVKALREVSRPGLERWEPVAKVAFPLEGGRSGDRDGCAAPCISTPSATCGREPRGVHGPRSCSPAARSCVVEAHKRRVRYSVGGCTSEVS